MCEGPEQEDGEMENLGKDRGTCRTCMQLIGKKLFAAAHFRNPASQEVFAHL